MCLVPIEAISPMEHATLKINHEYKPLNMCSNPKAYINQMRGQSPHISFKSKISCFSDCD